MDKYTYVQCGRRIGKSIAMMNYIRKLAIATQVPIWTASQTPRDMIYYKVRKGSPITLWTSKGDKFDVFSDKEVYIPCYDSNVTVYPSTNSGIDYVFVSYPHWIHHPKYGAITKWAVSLSCTTNVYRMDDGNADNSGYGTTGPTGPTGAVGITGTIGVTGPGGPI